MGDLQPKSTELLGKCSQVNYIPAGDQCNEMPIKVVRTTRMSNMVTCVYDVHQVSLILENINKHCIFFICANEYYIFLYWL